MDYALGIRGLIARLKKIILNENFSLAKAENQASIEKAKEEIDKMFRKYDNFENSHIIVLDTFFKNLENTRGHEDSKDADSLLKNVSNKLICILDTELKKYTNEDIPNEEEFKTDFDTFKQLASIDGDEKKIVRKTSQFHKNKSLSAKLAFGKNP